MEDVANQMQAAAELAAAEGVEENFNRVLALIPIIQTTETLEEIATLLDIDLQEIAGNKKMLQRRILNLLNSDAFDQVAERGQLISSALETLQDHLNMPPLDGDNGNGQGDPQIPPKPPPQKQQQRQRRGTT